MTFASAQPPRDLSAGGVRRIELVDALRGFALLGVLMVNLRLVPLFGAGSSLLPVPLLALLVVLLLAPLFGASRVGVLRESVAHRRFWRRLFLASLTAALLLALRDDGANALRHQAASLAQGLFCVAGFVLLFQRTAVRRHLRKLAPMGRMALTNALVQGLIGLGLFHRLGVCIESVGALVVIAVAMAVFALQAMASCWWMARFRHGPAEWAWQRLVQARSVKEAKAVGASIVDVPIGPLGGPLRARR